MAQKQSEHGYFFQLATSETLASREKLEKNRGSHLQVTKGENLIAAAHAASALSLSLRFSLRQARRRPQHTPARPRVARARAPQRDQGKNDNGARILSITTTANAGTPQRRRYR